MLRHALHRWLVILMLLGRLVFGELAHAMPHEMGTMTPAVAIAAETQQCPDHHEHLDAPAPAQMPADAGAADHAVHQEHPGAHAGLHEPMTGDCCEQGACDCPCPYTPVAATTSIAKLDRAVDVRATFDRDGAVSGPPSLLFRPPA